jgi:hypothetical protein
MNFYREILKKAFQLIIRTPALWLFGLFAALAINGEEYDSFFSNVSFVRKTQPNLEALRLAVLDGRFGTFWHNLWGSFGSNGFTIGLFLLAALVIILLIAWLITVSQAALIRVASDHHDGKLIQPFEAFIHGMRCFWPLLALNLLALGIVWVPIAVLAIPFTILYVSGSAMVWAVLFTVIVFVLLIPVNIVIAFMIKYAASFVVIQETPLREAIKRTWQLFIKNWLISIELGLILFLINLVFTIILVSVLTMLGLPVTQYGVILFIAITVFTGALFAAFRYSAWTLLFREIIEDRGVAKLVRIFHPKALDE